jgi:hypothetical protein
MATLARLGLARRDRERPLNEAQRPHFRGVRVALGTNYNRVRGIGAGVAKRPREVISHPNMVNDEHSPFARRVRQRPAPSAPTGARTLLPGVCLMSARPSGSPTRHPWCRCCFLVRELRLRCARFASRAPFYPSCNFSQHPSFLITAKRDSRSSLLSLSLSLLMAGRQRTPVSGHVRMLCPCDTPPQQST